MAEGYQEVDRHPPGTSTANVTHESEAVAPGVSAPTKGRWRVRKRLGLYGLLIVLLAVGIPYGVRLWQYYRTHESTDDAYVVGDIVPLSSRVNGTVVAVNVEEHQQVEAGQVLARLDVRDFEVKVKQAEAAVAVARARLHRAELEVPLSQESTTSDTARTGATLRAARSRWREAQHQAKQAQARLRAQEAAVAAARAAVEVWSARLDMARRAFKRMQQLLADGVVAQQQFDEADSGLRAAQAEWQASRQKLIQAESEAERAQADLRTQQQAVKRARARIAEAQAALAGSQANRQTVDIKQAQVQVARALLQQAQANLDYARLQRAYTTLRAPVAGVIAKKRLEVGQVVQAGRPLLALVPLQHVWVEANFKETQLRHMRPGQRATLKVDAYPGRVFTGKVESISPGTGAIFSLFPPENATGNFVKVVQRVAVKIVLEASSRKGLALRPGMSVIATVATGAERPD